MQSPLRANSPTNNDFEVLNVPAEASPTDQLPNDVKQLAREASSPKGSIILTHIQEKIDVQKKVLFGEDLTKMPAEEIGQRTLASMRVISILETVISDCETAVKAVQDATNTGQTI